MFDFANLNSFLMMSFVGLFAFLQTEELEFLEFKIFEK